MDVIKIRGARTHNLKNIDLDIKMNAVTVLSGPSGSGKTSLAFHTLLTESKRRFLNSFPTDIKFFWDIPQTADVDSIFPVLPVWGLSQHNPVVGSRPCVVDHLDLSEKFEKVFQILGQSTCSTHRIAYQKFQPAQAFRYYCEQGGFSEGDHVHIFVERSVFQQVFGEHFYPARGFRDGVCDFDKDLEHWEVLRVKYSIDEKKIEKDLAKVSQFLNQEWLVHNKRSGKSLSVSLSAEMKCPKCYETSELREQYPQSLSPFNAIGACRKCQGHGMLLVYDQDKLVKDARLSLEEGAVHLVNYSRFSHYLPLLVQFFKKEGLNTKIPFEELPERKWDLLYVGGGKFPGLLELLAYLEARKYKKNVRIYLRSLQKEELCSQCLAVRVSPEAQRRLIQIDKYKITYGEILRMTLDESGKIFSLLEQMLKSQRHERYQNLKTVLASIDSTLTSCQKMNLGHLPLIKKVRTLSAGVYQRLLLVKFTSFEGSGSLLILDEPSLGLNLLEQKILVEELRKVQKQGNTIILIDHSRYIHECADDLIIMGPGAGHLGGTVTFQGKYKKKKEKLLTSQNKARKKVLIKLNKIKMGSFSLQQVDLVKNGINSIVGNSNSGKEEFVLKLLPFLISNNRKEIEKLEATVGSIEGADDIGHVIKLDGSVGRISSRSTIGTMLEITPQIRKHYASLDFSKTYNLEKGHFSPNSELGRCNTCEGRGVISHDMQFLEDVIFTCDDCKGMKLKPFYAEISNGQFNFHEAVSRPMDEILPFVPLTAKFKRIWEYIKILNLGYLSLDRSFSSLSGGERLRVKLLGELTKSIRDSLLIFENLSFGLSSVEIAKMALFLEKLTDDANTVVLLDESPEIHQYCDKVLKL